MTELVCDYIVYNCILLILYICVSMMAMPVQWQRLSLQHEEHGWILLFFFVVCCWFLKVLGKVLSSLSQLIFSLSAAELLH